EKHFSATSKAACIHALRLIGSDEALNALENYISETDSNVIEALVAAWDSFDRETYARKVLAHVLRGTFQCPYSLPSIQGLEYFIHITGLVISEHEIAKDWSLPKRLPLLKELTIENHTENWDLSPLTSLTNLTSLTIVNLGGGIDYD